VVVVVALIGLGDGDGDGDGDYQTQVDTAVGGVHNDTPAAQALMPDDVNGPHNLGADGRRVPVTPPLPPMPQQLFSAPEDADLREDFHRAFQVMEEPRESSVFIHEGRDLMIMIIDAIRWSRAFLFMFNFHNRHTNVPDNIDKKIAHILVAIDRLESKRRQLNHMEADVIERLNIPTQMVYIRRVVEEIKDSAFQIRQMQTSQSTQGLSSV